MKRLFRSFVMIFLCVCLCTAVSSCTKKPKPGPDTSVTTPPGPTDAGSGSDITGTLPDNDKTEVVTLRYYTVSANGQLERATSLVNKETITPELVLDYLLDSLEDESLMLKVDSVSVIDSVCVVSFDDSIYDIAAEGEQIENSVLDAIAQSILDNVEDVSGVKFRIKNNRYITVNNEFSLDSVYME